MTLALKSTYTQWSNLKIFMGVNPQNKIFSGNFFFIKSNRYFKKLKKTQFLIKHMKYI